MRQYLYILALSTLVLSGCSVKKNNFFSRNYHQMTTRYNVYFNGNQALKAGEKKMENGHKEDYTTLLPVFVSNNEWTRAYCSSDMDYAIEKAVKAIDNHSITVKPRRRKNKDSRNYQTFRKKKEFNKQLDKCYLLLGKAYFYKKKYTMANNTFRFIQRQYTEDKKIQTETEIWLFRSLTEMGRYDEALQWMKRLEGEELSHRQMEMMAAARTDFYVRQGMYDRALPETEKLLMVCRNLKQKPRYNYMLAQLYLKVGQQGNALVALKKAARFNFNYEMVFNAKINMALAVQGKEDSVEKMLWKMLKDSRNDDFQGRIYYALGNIEEKRGEEQKAVDLYWKSVRTSEDHDNQQALSFRKLGDYYFKNKDYVQAQSCYDSCMYVIDSRYEDYEQLKALLADLTALTTCLNTIQVQDSLVRLATLSETERNKIIDGKIQEIRAAETAERDLARQAMEERNFYERNNMLGERDTRYGSVGEQGGNDWYFYNPMTLAMGKNEFKRKWGRRKLEDHWRRRNKVIIDFSDRRDDLLTEELGAGKKEENLDKKSREYYLKDLPLTEAGREESEKKVKDAYYEAGELYLYKFNDPVKALECFDDYIRRFPEDENLPVIYYLAHTAAKEADKTKEAEAYKQELISKFPESDFALALQDSEYFNKVDDALKSVEKLYEQAYAFYNQVYYQEAEQLCDRILQQYPDNKLKVNVLFLKAMCRLNTSSMEEGKSALERVLSFNPPADMRAVVAGILTSISTGKQPVTYLKTDMDQARHLQANRNWRFDEEVQSGKTEKEATTYQLDKEVEQVVVMLMPEDMTTAEELRYKARLTFINASEAADGKSYEFQKEDLWYNRQALIVRKFENSQEASEYFNRVATDRYLLKIIGNRFYRMFIMDENNLSVFKRIKNVEEYTDFFAENYFTDRRKGEILCGKFGTAAHAFGYAPNASHHFVLAVPFREVNTKRMAEILHRTDPAYTLAKESYDDRIELIVVKDVGTTYALDYMNAVLKNKELFERLVGVDYKIFIITEQNLKTMLENEYLNEYVKFFEDNYLKAAESVGVEDGGYIYNKSVPHKFMLIYSNSLDPFKLKGVFEEFNFAGLSISNQRFDEEYDYMTVSGFNSKEEAMRYFNAVMTNRKLFKVLRGVNYTNFIITEVNLQTLLEKKIPERYLEFFRKYYLN